jgi:SAM-dependent methyltransferase
MSGTEDDTRTIADFGAQWTRYRDSPGYYGSTELLRDVLEPLVGLEAVRGARVGEVGSGTGRIVHMLLECGAAHVVAVEPSEAMDVLRESTREHADRISYVHGPGTELPADLTLDLIMSIGVLHHVVDPDPIVRRMHEALRPGGRAFVWLYGREGNELYLSVVLPLRRITRNLPDPVLAALCHGLNVMLSLYLLWCRVLPAPMRGYMLGHVRKLDRRTRFLTIFDQLNPRYARYYRREEALDLLRRSGFRDVRSHHRHGYSWSVVGTKQ